MSELRAGTSIILKNHGRALTGTYCLPSWNEGNHIVYVNLPSRPLIEVEQSAILLPECRPTENERED